MPLNEDDFFTDVWALDSNEKKVHPYKGEYGHKRGLFSVNFTNDTKKFQGLTEEQLIDAIVAGRFRTRGTIRVTVQTTTSCDS